MPERADTGEYVESVSTDMVLKAIDVSSYPVVTVRDVADALDCSGETARRKLNQLHDEGEVERRKVGATAVVWWVDK